jgi:hypothetical protein
MNVFSIITRRFRFIGILLFVFTFSMAISFTTVRLLTRDLSLVRRVDAATWEQAVQLRQWTVSISRIAAAWRQQAPGDNAALSPAARRWIQEEFRRDVQRLRRKIAAAQVRPAAANIHQALAAAVERLAALAAHPEDTALRRAAIEEARRAAARAETWIRDSGVRNLPHPPQVLDE